MLALLSILSTLVVSNALVDIPHRARGGSLFQEHVSSGRLVELGDGSDAKTITQPLDHTNPDQGTFEQRYYEDMSAWGDAGKPIFVYIGGEGPLGGLPSGYAAEMARQHNAALLALEARFYGESVPLEADGVTKNFTVQAMQFLTVENHLQDLDVFIRKWVSDHKATGVVGVIGGSYPGGLAAWFRVAYPKTATWAWSSSGVVNALVDFPQFDEHISNALNAYNTTCRDLVHRTMEAFSTAFHAGGSEATKAASYFNGAPADANDALYMVNDAAAMMVQYGAKTQLCAGMKDGTDDELMQRFGAMTIQYWGKDFGKDCFYDTDCLKNDPSRWQPTSRSWRWQKCAQVGWLQRAPNKDPIRATSLTLAVLEKQCNDVFGSAVPAEPDAAGINAKYGGDTPKTDHVVATEFSDDPWLEVGVMHSISSTYPRLLANCTDCGHCNDLHSPSDSDPPPLTALRQAEAAHIQQWIKDAEEMQ